MTSLSKAPHLLSSSAASNQSSQNSDPNVASFIEDEWRAFLTASISISIVITVPLGHEITLSADHLNLPTPSVYVENITFTLIAPMPSGVVLTGLKPEGDVAVFTYQDLIDGKVTVSVTDPMAIIDLRLSLDDGQNPPLEMTVEIIPPEAMASQSSQADFQAEAQAIPQSNNQDQTDANAGRTVYIHSNPERSNVIDLTGDTTSYYINGEDGHDRIKSGSGDDVINGGLGDDEVDLSNGGQDEIEYNVGGNGRIYALSGEDHIIGFKRGEDILAIKLDLDGTQPADLDAFFDVVDGDDSNAIDYDDQLIISLLFFCSIKMI